MQNRSLFSTVLLLALLAICVLSVSAFGTSPRTQRRSITLPRSQVTINPSEIDNLLAIAQTWPFIQPFWTRETLSTACAIPAPVRGITGCNSNGFVTGLDLQGESSMKSVPLLESIETLTSLENFTSTLPFTQQLPHSWSKLTLMRNISMKSTQISGGVIPEEWKAMIFLRDFELEFLPTFEVFQYPAGNMPAWFRTLYTLKLSNVNFGRSASIAGFFPIVETLNLTNVGWDYDLESISGMEAIYLKSLSIMAPWSLAREAGPAQPYILDWTLSLFLRVFELSNLPNINQFPALPSGIETISLRNLPNLAGSTRLREVWDTLRHIDISFCPLLTGPVPFPSDPSTSPIESIAINNVGFTGNIPTNVFSSPTLKTFTLTNLPKLTQFDWPKESSSCGITSLTLSSLQMSGSIPEYIATTCSKLEKLDLSSNAISGLIPNTWTSRSMRYFSVASNHISGPLPTTLTFDTQPLSDGSMPSNWLSVHGNAIDGTIPAKYFDGLFKILDVAENKLTLCGNAGDLGSGPVKSLKNAWGCYIAPQAQAPSVCECASIWPSMCLPPGAC